MLSPLILTGPAGAPGGSSGGGGGRGSRGRVAPPFTTARLTKKNGVPKEWIDFQKIDFGEKCERDGLLKSR
jgi:hypothetical protein